jgi:hypothetical protein
MTIVSPLLTLFLLVLLTLCVVGAARWKVFVEPDAATRMTFMLRDDERVKSDTLTMLARCGWFIAAIIVLYAIGRVQGVIS